MRNLRVCPITNQLEYCAINNDCHMCYEVTDVNAAAVEKYKEIIKKAKG